MRTRTRKTCLVKKRDEEWTKVKKTTWSRRVLYTHFLPVLLAEVFSSFLCSRALR